MSSTLLPFFTLGQQNAFTYAFFNSDGVGQAICCLLLLFSVATWVIMIEKGTGLNKADSDDARFLRLFREKRNPLALSTDPSVTMCPFAAIYAAACEKIEAFHLDSMGARRALSNDELDVVRATLDQAIEEQIILLEKRMTLLATAVSGCPFLGLFGTVWGITIAFTNLAMQGKADISTLAPGVSGALLTTVIALVVAIPSLVGYNYVNAKIRTMTVALDNFAEEFHTKLKIEQMDSLRAAQRN